MKMKKILSLALALALIFGILGAAKPHVHALDYCEDEHTDCDHSDGEAVESEENAQVASLEAYDDFTISGGVEYEIPEEYRREYYQLTEEELSAPTAELIDLILEHDMLLDLGVSNFAERPAYNTMRKTYNALPELESRPDAVAAIIAKFAELLSQPAQWDALCDLWDLRDLLFQSVYLERIPDSLMEKFESLLATLEDYCESEVFDTLPEGWVDVESLPLEERKDETLT